MPEQVMTDETAPTTDAPVSPPWNRTTRRIMALVLIAILLLVAWRFQGLIAQVIFAALAAYLLNPLIHVVQQRTPLGRIPATLLIYLLLVIIVLGGTALLGVAAVNQLSDLSERLPELLDSAIEYVARISNNPDARIVIGPYELSFADLNWNDVGEQALTMVNPALRAGPAAAGQVAAGTFSVIGWVALTFVLSIYLAIDMPRYGGAFDRISEQSGYYHDIMRLRHELLQIGQAYLRGQVILGLVVGALTSVLLGVLGVNNALALGLVSGILELVPYFGPLLSAVIAVLVAFFQPDNYLGLGQFAFALATMGVMLLIQQIENNFLVPRVVGEALNLKPLTVIIAVIMGAAIAGIVGIILAAPVAAAIKLVGGYMWRKMLGLPPFPPEDETGDGGDQDGPSLIGRTLSRIRSRTRLVEDEAAGPVPGDPTPVGEGEPPQAARS